MKLVTVENIFQQERLKREREFLHNGFKAGISFDDDFIICASKIFAQLEVNNCVTIDADDVREKDFAHNVIKRRDEYADQYLVTSPIQRFSTEELWHHRYKSDIYCTVAWFYKKVFDNPDGTNIIKVKDK